MKNVIEIECPEGYKLDYDECTSKIKVVPDNVSESVRTSDDALNKLGLPKLETSNPSVNALYELQAVLDVLNEGHKFSIDKGSVWYPWVTFYTKDKTPKGAQVIGEFYYKGTFYSVVGGDSYHCSNTGLGNFYHSSDSGSMDPTIGALACKSKEVADYVSSKFGKLIFEICFRRYFNSSELQWL